MRTTDPGFFVLLLTICATAAYDREKRSLFNFYGVVRCSTGRNPLSAYNGYGCNCGRGGTGEAIDEIDRCCYVHDECYRALREHGLCNKLTRYTEGYDWECVPGKNLLRHVDSSYLDMIRNITSTSRPSVGVLFNDAINSTSYPHLVNSTSFSNTNEIQLNLRNNGTLIDETRKYPVCKKGRSNCGSGLCFCDVQAALCFAEHVYPKLKPKCPKQK